MADDEKGSGKRKAAVQIIAASLRDPNAVKRKKQFYLKIVEQLEDFTLLFAQNRMISMFDLMCLMCFV